MKVRELREKLLEIPNQNAKVMNKDIIIDNGSTLIVIPLWQTVGKAYHIDEVIQDGED